MAYNVKYRIQYKRLSGSYTTIDILQNNYTGGTITELTAGKNPLEISFAGDIENIFSPTIGSGAVIQVVAVPMTLMELFTDNPQEFIVKVYNSLYSGTNLIWQGFVNAEIYSEGYTDHYTTIEIHCNDGLAVLDYIPYRTTGNTYYTGTTSISAIFGTVLNKLNITFTNIFFSSDLRITDYSRNLFLHLFLPQENFIDETGVVMSCRKVLESILSGWGMVMKFKGQDIFIYDPINMHDTSKWKLYGVSPVIGYDSGALAEVDGYVDLSASTFNWFQTGAQLDIIPGYSEVQVKYNPYTFTEYKYDFDDNDNWLVEGSFASASGGGSTYYKNEAVRFDGWTTTGTLHNELGVKETNSDSPTFGFTLNNYGIGNTLKYTFPFSNITMDYNLKIRVSMDVYVQTKASTWNIFCSGTSHQIYDLKIPISVKVGDKYYKTAGGGWSTSFNASTECTAFVVRQPEISATDYTKSNISDTWTTASILIPIAPTSSHTGYDELLQGNIELTIYDSIKTYFSSQARPNTTYLYVIFLKNIKVELIDQRTGKATGNDGVVMKANLSPNLTAKSIFEIKTTSGTGTYGNSRGAFKTDHQYNIGMNISGLIRSMADTGGTSYNTAKLVLQSFISQYKKPRLKLSGVLDVKNYLFTMDTMLIKDSTYMGIKAFYISSGIYNDKYENMDVEMLELTDTRESL
jgi:hypothetical protein